MAFTCAPVHAVDLAQHSALRQIPAVPYTYHPGLKVIIRSLVDLRACISGSVTSIRGNANAGSDGCQRPRGERHPAQQVHMPLRVRGVAAPADSHPGL